MMSLRSLVQVVFLASLVLTHSASAAERWTIPLTERNWQDIKVPGIAENRYQIRDQVLKVQSDNSVSFRYFKLPASIQRPDFVSWSWKVDSFSEVVPQTVAGRDDRPLAIHIWFDDGSDKSLFGNLGTLFGYPKVGHLLTYVWGADDAVGSVLQNPHYEKGKLIILVGDQGKTGEWSKVTRDIVRDYRRAFGTSPDMSDLRYIAVSADSDDLDGHSVGAVRSLSLKSSNRLAAKASNSGTQ
ncbi:MAG: DUF3047 domain-containing protein [Pseudomonadota bacterium]